MTAAKAPLPFLGTWKLTKCEPTRPDLPHPVSGIATATEEADGIHFKSEGTWSDGRAVKTSAVYKMDGNWYPVTGSLVTDSISVRRLDDLSWEGRLRKNGVDAGTQLFAVSADRRTMTTQVDVVGPGGAVISWKTTQERQ